MRKGERFPAHIELVSYDKHAVVKRFFAENLVEIDIFISNWSPEIRDSEASGDFKSRLVDAKVSD